MNAKAAKDSKTTKGSRSGQKPNPQTSPQAAPNPTTGESVESSAQSAPVAPPRGKRAKGEATLGDVVAGYLEHLEEADKSEGTIFSYRMDLKAAVDHFGEDTAASTLTPTKVANFYESDAVTQKRNGKKRSTITISKTRRVFRLAMTWAAENGLIEKLPIPADEMEHARGAAKADEKSKPVTTKKTTRKAKAVDVPAVDPAPEATATPAE
ncbi:MAG: site-specific integrase [Planctomycetes bacterium]|nr:site-specific integrase [Planctomycetota bacterium]